jgi:hypothetical protein
VKSAALAESEVFAPFLVDDLRLALTLHYSGDMRIKPILITLGILGSSSLALADPQWGRDRDRDRDRYGERRDGRWNDYRRDNYGYGRFNTSWVALSPSQRLDRGGEVFDVRTRERFAQLRLQNQTGRTLVRSIEIVFGNGRSQHIAVNRVLRGNDDMVNVDLPGDQRRIDTIIVHGRSGRNASYQLYAM